LLWESRVTWERKKDHKGKETGENEKGSSLGGDPAFLHDGGKGTSCKERPGIEVERAGPGRGAELLLASEKKGGEKSRKGKEGR